VGWVIGVAQGVGQNSYPRTAKKKKIHSRTLFHTAHNYHKIKTDAFTGDVWAIISHLNYDMSDLSCHEPAVYQA
jgi:hypothetical protein